MQYEINYLVLQSKTAQIDQIRQEIKQLIETENGKITGERNYLKRKLAYEISHENYGFYTVLRFEMEDTENVAKLKRELNLNGNVSRYIVVKANELPPLEQAPTMKEETTETSPENEKSKGVLDEIMNEPKPAPTPKEEIKADAPKAEAPKTEDEKSQAAEETQAEEKKVTAEEKKEEPKEEKKPEVKDEKEEKNEEKKEKSKEDDKASLDELDKKLDEILNI